MRRLLLARCVLLLAGVSLPVRAAETTLFDELGGRPGIERIVAEAVGLYTTDPRISADFDNIEPAHLRARLVEHLCVVTDGPCTYTGRSMSASHKGLHLGRAQFNAVAEDFQTAMERCGISYRTQNRVLARLAPMQRDIVTR